MGIGKWIKRRMAILSLAMAGVEKNALGQNNNGLEASINQERRHTEGTLADSLKQGKITQEVMDLRWRTYKLLKASEGLSTEITQYGKDGVPVTVTRKVDRKKGLSKVKLDTYDSYPLVMVVDNTPIVSSGNDVLENENIIIHDATINYNDKGEIVSATHGEIAGEEYFATTKADLPINITRENPTKFDIEAYTKRLNVRKIDETKYLLEFYVSKYPDEYDRRSRLFISDVKKAIGEPKTSSMFEIKDIGFVTYKTLGVEDFLTYQYIVDKFDKIIDFNGYYVIKFICDVVIDGIDILEAHRMTELDNKYENKEKKKQ